MIHKNSTNGKPTISPSAYGVALISIPMLGLPFVDATAKYLMQENFTLLQIASGRFFFQAIFAGILILYCGNSIKKTFTTHIVPKTIMSLGTVGLTVGFYLALQYTSISIALALLFLAPSITTILSVSILKERITIYHIFACIVGFIGAMLIIRPGTESFNSGALFAILSAFSWSAMSLTSRISKGKLNSKETQCFTGVFTTITFVISFYIFNPSIDLLPISTPFWQAVSVMGILSAIFYILVQSAHSYTPASTLAPLQYFEIISGLALDYVLFNTIPDMLSWIGINVIIVSGLIIWNMNRKENMNKQRCHNNMT